MKKLTLALLATVALLTVGAATSAAGAATSACTGGQTTYQGFRARTWCGPATAVVKVGGRTLQYRGGSCTRTPVALELGIGTGIVDAKDPKVLPRNFGISVGRIFGVGKAASRDGVFQSVALAYVDGGKRYASLKAEATLAGGRTRGTFTGRLLTGQPISGSFRCS
jgi:hypothetical protein